MKSGRDFVGVMGMLAALSLCSFGDGLKAPQITLFVTDEPLNAVLERIAEQARVSIVMTNEAAGRETINLRVRNAELENALDQALSDYNYTLSFSAKQNVISKVIIAVQEKKEGVVMPVVAVTAPMPQALLKPNKSQPLDYSKIPAFPPRPNGEKSISVAELRESLERTKNKIDREAVSAFPTVDGRHSISLADMDRLMERNETRRVE